MRVQGTCPEEPEFEPRSLMALLKLISNVMPRACRGIRCFPESFSKRNCFTSETSKVDIGASFGAKM